MALVDLHLPTRRRPLAPRREPQPRIPVDDERFAHAEWEPRRRVDSYAQDRPLRRAVIESAITFGLMVLLMVAILAFRAWLAFSGGP
jgi:hypothetical protein